MSEKREEEEMGTERHEACPPSPSSSPWNIPAATKECSWTVAGGSLDDVVTCESSFSAVQSDGFIRKQPLVLRRPSADFDPNFCQITIGFSQRHEVKQIYVRSTARVYEVYCAGDDKDENEYLCTVRCGAVAPSEDTRVLESLSTASSGSTKASVDAVALHSSGSSSNDVAWVHVKLPDSSPSPPHAANMSISNGDEAELERDNLVFFEATAEISDAEPVFSVTLRLLSIQSGDQVYVDEVYVFADPVASDLDDTDSSSSKPETSSGSAFMSMLVPTLLQLSKSRMSRLQERDDSAAVRLNERQDSDHDSAAAARTSNAFQPGKMVNSVHNINRASENIHIPQVPAGTPDLQDRYASVPRDINCSRMERSFDELITRVSRIESFCLRFEESLLKPVTSMEARLERVEKQLESFIKGAQFLRTDCTKFSAPEFASIESESTSTCTDGNNHSRSRISESIKMDNGHLEELLRPTSDISLSSNIVQPSDMPSSTRGAQLLPSLVVTAPDFSYVDDEEELEATEAIKDSPKNGLKKPLSIDDALASALSGFLHSASTSSLKCTDMVEEGADFSSSGGSDHNLSASILSDGPLCPPVHIDEGDETITNCCKVSLAAEQETCAAGDGCEETTRAVDGHDHIIDEGGGHKTLDSPVRDVACPDKGVIHEDSVVTDKEPLAADCEEINEAVDEQYCDSGTKHHDGSCDCVVAPGKAKMVDNDLSSEVGFHAADDDSGLTFVSDSLDMPASSLPSKDVYVASPQVGGQRLNSSSGEVVVEDGGVLQKILELSNPATVDFEFPILNVRFSSLGTDYMKSPVEALLIDEPQPQIEDPCIKEVNKISFIEQNDLILFEAESSISEPSTYPLFFLDNYDSENVPSSVEEEMQPSHVCNDQDMCPSLI